jgi:hypothetical protein
MSTQQVTKDMHEKANVTITVEPAEVRVGFKHIDFLNMVAVEV